MGKGSRTRVRPLRLTDLWSRRRTSPACTAFPISDINVVVSPECSSFHSSSLNMTDGALLDTVASSGVIVGATSGTVVSDRYPPSISPVGVLDSVALPYPSVNTRHDVLDLPCSSHNLNSTIPFAVGSRPAAVADLSPLVASVSVAINSVTGHLSPASKHCSSSDNLPPRKRQRLSLPTDSSSSPP